jgi:hypothetical protein
MSKNTKNALNENELRFNSIKLNFEISTLLSILYHVYNCNRIFYVITNLMEFKFHVTFYTSIPTKSYSDIQAMRYYYVNDHDERESEGGL